MAYRTRDLLLIGLFGVVSCRDPFALSDCPDDIEITVSAGTTPEIDWTPRCHLAVLYLVSEYERSNVWSISGRRHDYTCADNTGCASPLNTLYPPIRYNVVPRDAFQDFPISGQPQALRLGWPYTVHLRRSGPVSSREVAEVWLAVHTFYVTATPALSARRSR